MYNKSESRIDLFAPKENKVLTGQRYYLERNGRYIHWLLGSMVARQFLLDRLNSVFLQVSAIMVFLLQALCQHLNRLNFLRRHRLLTILLGQSAFEFFFRLALPLRLKFCDGCTGLRSCWFPEICWTLANLAHNSPVDKLVMLHVSSYLVIFLTKIKTLVERGVKDLLSRIF